MTQSIRTTRRRPPTWASRLGPGDRQGAAADFRALVASTAPFGCGVASDVALGMSERVLQAHIRGFLQERGFVVVVVPDMRKTVAGWPDLCFWHPDRPGRLYCWELKREGRYPTARQRAALEHLATVPGVDARIVRPSNWPILRDRLMEEMRS